jgi:hypothetical protein
LLYFPAAATYSFFDRRTNAITRAFGSPNTPRTLDDGRNPSKAYVSHSRRVRLIDFAMNLPCRFSEDSQTIRSGSHGKSELFVTKVDPLDYAMSHYIKSYYF